MPTKPTRGALVEGTARFLPEEKANFLIDNTKFSFSFSYRRRVEFLSACRAISPEAALEGVSGVDLRTLGSPVLGTGPGGVPAVFWKSQLGKFWLATRRGRAMVADFNPIVAVRRGMTVDEQRAHVKRVLNYLEPRVISRAKAHEACLSYVNDSVRQCCQHYCEIVKHLWGFAADPSDVLVSINAIELTWDQRTRPGLAGLGSRLFWEAWKQSYANAREVAEGTRYHRMGSPDRQVGRVERDATGELKGVGKNGEIVKLYRKTEDLLRFEAQLTKHNAKKILGRRLDPGNVEEFAEGLKEIAATIYAEFLDAQALAISPSVPSLTELFTALLLTEPARYVTEQLVLTGVVKNRDQATYKALRRLRERGLARIGAGKGEWCVTAKHAETLAVLRRVFEAEAAWRAP